MLGRAAAALVRLYQATLSFFIPASSCRYSPSCSEYSIDAFRANGLVKGLALTVWRLLRCAPWCKGGADPAPILRDGPVRALVHRHPRRVSAGG